MTKLFLSFAYVKRSVYSVSDNVKSSVLVNIMTKRDHLTKYRTERFNVVSSLSPTYDMLSKILRQASWRSAYISNTTPAIVLHAKKRVSGELKS